jgi:predicted short-subunit dehydrogenase-like oxidoreductase (DUF2520 family)
MQMPNTPPGHAIKCVAIVGAGRLGTALAGALDAAGVDVVGPLGRDESFEADVALLCVPDGEIATAAQALHGASGIRFVGHTSGATPIATLAAADHEAFGLHPLQTFAGGENHKAFHGVGCAIAGSRTGAVDVARELALKLGMLPIEISDADRAAYHAAASVASNFLVTLQHAAEQLATGAGLERHEARALLAPLVRSTVDNWAERGPEAALTGPVARGDEATVERQRDAVEAVAPELLDLFDVLVERTRELAATREVVTA